MQRNQIKRDKGKLQSVKSQVRTIKKGTNYLQRGGRRERKEYCQRGGCTRDRDGKEEGREGNNETGRLGGCEGYKKGENRMTQERKSLIPR